jgi:hypothetical protein
MYTRGRNGDLREQVACYLRVAGLGRLVKQEFLQRKYWERNRDKKERKRWVRKFESRTKIKLPD